MRYRYRVEGTAADGQTWTVQGAIAKTTGADFNGLLAEAMADSFRKLTGGRAVFGRPGVGCRGPYKITKFSVEVDEGEAR